MHKYLPHTEADLQAMMERVGIEQLEQLYSGLPESIRFRGDYELPEGMSEIEVRQAFRQLASLNLPLTCFAGAGVYDHYTPALVPQLIARSEFLTSYTPYQAEISQGTLHYIFEFQTLMARLTGMDISNASMYDGTTAAAEAVMMAATVSKKSKRVLISDGLDPKTMAVVQTYAHVQGIDIVTVPLADGVTDSEALRQLLAEGPVAGLLVQQPNRYGIVEDFTGMADAVHEAKGLFIIDSIAADLALLRTPGEWGADVAVGDAQSLGIPMAWGGPYVGYFCATEKLMRKMPGRIVGQTVDSKGQRAFVLTLQAREQHIRRQKATSNICSNQSLMALFVTIYLATLGPQGLAEAAQLSYAGAHYMAERLTAKGHFALVYPRREFFNEFLVSFDGDAEALLRFLTENGIFGGIHIGEHQLLIAVTEQRTRDEVDRYLQLVDDFISNNH